MTEIAAQPERPILPIGEHVVQVAKRVSGNSYDRLNSLRKSIASGTKVNIANAAVVGTMLLHAGCAVDTPQNPSPNAPNKGGEIARMIKDATPAVSSLKPPEIQVPAEYTQTREGFTVFFDSELQIPLRYTTPDGKIVSFDRNEMVAIRNKAIASKEPEVAAVLPQQTVEDATRPSPEHPVLSEKPQDVLSEEELRRHGISIIQGKDTQLFIRQNAFSETGPLARYGREDPSKKLTIALVDGPVVQRYFLQDVKYDLVRDFYPTLTDEQQQLQEYKQKQLQAEQANLEAHRNRIAQLRLKGNKQEIASAEESFLRAKAELYSFERLTDDQVTKLMYASSSKEGGSYISAGNRMMESIYSYDRRLLQTRFIGEENNTVFLAVGKVDNDMIVEANVAFTSEGKPQLGSQIVSRSGTVEPRAHQSYPNPAVYSRDFTASENDPKSYPFAAQSPGFGLHHELAHDQLMRGNVEKGLLPIRNEYTTDMKAFDEIAEAWNHWAESGYKDDSKYPFVFSLPSGKGYIVTERPEKDTGVV